MGNNSNRSPDSEEYKRGMKALKKIGFLLLNFALVFALFRFVIALSVRLNTAWIYYLGMVVYAAVTSGVFVAFFVLNGFTFGKEMRTADELPARWTDEQRAEFLEKQPANKKKAQKLVYVMFALVLTMIVEFIELYIFG